MTSYSRLRLILDSHPGAIYSLNTRITQAGLSLPDRSMVVLASEVKELRGSLPGEYAVSFRPSRRNHKAAQRLGGYVDFPEKIQGTAKFESLINENVPLKKYLFKYISDNILNFSNGISDAE